MGPVSTSIPSIDPAGVGSSLSSRSTESDLVSWIEPLIATRIAPMRIVRSVGGLSDGAEDWLAGCCETRGAAKVDVTKQFFFGDDLSGVQQKL